MTSYVQQRLASPRKVSVIIHVAGLLSFAVSFSWLPKIASPRHNGVGGSYQFLTIIALTMSTITFAVGLLADVSRSKQLFALKNMLSACATPLEVLVSFLYWGSRAVDKTFVVPPGHELPFVPDFGFHAVPALMLTLDFMLLSPPSSVDAYSAMILDLVLAVSYWGWLEYCFSFNGWFPYPRLEHYSSWERLFLCVISAALMTGNYLVLKWLHGKVNGVEEIKKGTANPTKIDYVKERSN